MDKCLAALKARTPYCWLNPDYGRSAQLPYSLSDVFDAEARLARFAPLLAELFDVFFLSILFDFILFLDSFQEMLYSNYRK